MEAMDTTSHDFRKQRRQGMIAIAAAAPVALLLWLAVAHLTQPLAGMADVTARLVFALKCCCVAVLFCLVTGIEAVAHERLISPAFDPLQGYETRRLRVNQRYLQNTLEQTVVFSAGLLGLAVYCADGAAMRAVLASTVVWIIGRFCFWIGYHKSAAMRGLGAPSMALGMILLLYVAWRIGFEIAGVMGGSIPVALFLAIEVILFWTTSRPDARPRHSEP
jgi:hypothetical protein